MDRSPGLIPGARSGGWPFGTEPTPMTAADMEAGEPGNPTRCPVALIIKRKYPDLEDLQIEGPEPTYKFTGHQRMPLTMGTDIAMWIGQYDRGENPAPLEHLRINLEKGPRE